MTENLKEQLQPNQKQGSGVKALKPFGQNPSLGSQKAILDMLTMIFLCVVPYTVLLTFSQETNTAVSFQIHAPPEIVVGKEIHDP